MMCKALHSRDDMVREQVSREEGGRRVASFDDDNVDTLIRRYKDYIKSNERLITDQKSHKQAKHQQNNHDLKAKMGRYFKRQSSETPKEKTWIRLRKKNLKKGCKFLLAAT